MSAPTLLRSIALGLFVAVLATSAAAADKARTRPVAQGMESIQASEHQSVAARDVSLAPAYNLDRWSVNGGGATQVSGTNYGLGLSVGQAAAGYATGTNYDIGVGFWYGAAPGGGCPMTIFGDVDLGGTVTSGDIIYLVNFVFKGGPPPCNTCTSPLAGAC